MVKPFSPHSSIRAPAVRGPPGFLKTEPAHGWSNGVPALRHRSSRACNSLSLAGGSSMSASFASTTITLPRFEDRYLRSEEHTSELQSRLHLVCRLLLEKKKTHRCWHLPPTLYPVSRQQARRTPAPVKA